MARVSIPQGGSTHPFVSKSRFNRLIFGLARLINENICQCAERMAIMDIIWWMRLAVRAQEQCGYMYVCNMLVTRSEMIN